MSIMIMSRLFKMNLGGCNRKLLAVRLADFADDDGRGIYPGVARLAAETELSERTIQRILADFVREGILVVVKEATGRPGIANSYDFDLARLFSYTPSQTGDTVSPVDDGRGVTNEQERGDTDDRDGCHGDTRTVIEPPIEPPSRRASAEEGGLARVDRKKIETDFTLWYATWKKGDIEFARNAWFALSEEERAECIERTPAYLRWAKADDIRAAAVFLKHRMWRDMPEELVAAPTRGIAKVCGKLWMGTRLATLSREPTGRIIFTAFDEREIAAGRARREALAHSKRLEHGWPLVTTMRDLARRKEPFVTSLALLPAVSGFRQVKSDSALFAAWADLHERHGWPFIEHPHEYVWFPAVDDDAGDLNQAVEDALAAFLSTISEAGNDDAA